MWKGQYLTDAPLLADCYQLSFEAVVPKAGPWASAAASPGTLQRHRSSGPPGAYWFQNSRDRTGNL